MGMAAPVAADPSLVILPCIAMGLVIGAVELFFVHADEKGLGWLSHGLHALPVMMLFIFISMNINYALGLIGYAWLQGLWVEIAVRVLVGLIAMAKIASAAAIAGNVGEKKIHVLIVGVLVMAAPYLWEFFLQGIFEAYVPWLT